MLISIDQWFSNWCTWPGAAKEFVGYDTNLWGQAGCTNPIYCLLGSATF